MFKKEIIVYKVLKAYVLEGEVLQIGSGCTLSLGAPFKTMVNSKISLY